MKKPVNGQIAITGRRWFQKTYGNTYHSVTVYVNNETLYHGFAHGYDDHYKQTAHKLLLTNGYDVPEHYFDFLNLDIVTDVVDVSRKRDL